MSATTFWDTFERKLSERAARVPANYALGPDESPENYARKTRGLMQAAGIAACNTGSESFKATCRALGIRHNQKAMREYCGQAPGEGCHIIATGRNTSAEVTAVNIVKVHS
jgi:hypothetical protein